MTPKSVPTVGVCVHLFTTVQGVTLEEHTVECVKSGNRRPLPPAMTDGGVMKLMSFAAFSTASVKSKVRLYSRNTWFNVLMY